MGRDGQGHLIAIQKRNRNKTWPSENAPKRFVYLALVLWPTKPTTFDSIYDGSCFCLCIQDTHIWLVFFGYTQTCLILLEFYTIVLSVINMRSHSFSTLKEMNEISLNFFYYDVLFCLVGFWLALKIKPLFHAFRICCITTFSARIIFVFILNHFQLHLWTLLTKHN